MKYPSCPQWNGVHATELTDDQLGQIPEPLRSMFLRWRDDPDGEQRLRDEWQTKWDASWDGFKRRLLGIRPDDFN